MQARIFTILEEIRLCLTPFFSYIYGSDRIYTTASFNPSFFFFNYEALDMQAQRDDFLFRKMDCLNRFQTQKRNESQTLNIHFFIF